MIQRFERCLPEEVGILSEGIDAFLVELENGGFTQMYLMIMRHGKVCAGGAVGAVCARSGTTATIP